MKTNRVDNHDYITVSVQSEDKARINFTVSFGGAKVTSSARPNTQGATDLTAAWNKNKQTLNMFLRGMPRKNCAPLTWISQVQIAGEVATSFDDFFTRLGACFAQVIDKANNTVAA